MDRIVLVAGDADFVPAAKLARREGIDFVLDSMHAHINKSLYEHIDGLVSMAPGPLLQASAAPSRQPAKGYRVNFSYEGLGLGMGAVNTVKDWLQNPYLTGVGLPGQGIMSWLSDQQPTSSQDAQTPDPKPPKSGD